MLYTQMTYSGGLCKPSGLSAREGRSGSCSVLRGPGWPASAEHASEQERRRCALLRPGLMSPHCPVIPERGTRRTQPRGLEAAGPAHLLTAPGSRAGSPTQWLQSCGFCGESCCVAQGPVVPARGFLCARSPLNSSRSQLLETRLCTSNSNSQLLWEKSNHYTGSSLL